MLSLIEDNVRQGAVAEDFDNEYEYIVRDKWTLKGKDKAGAREETGRQFM